jgi:hypothetical protein
MKISICFSGSGLQRIPPMKLSLKILALAIIAATTYSIIGCAAPAGFSYQNVAITLTAQCTDCPAGISFNPAYPVPTSGNGTQTNSSAIPPGAIITMTNQGEGGTIELLASVANAPANVTWTLYPTPNLNGIKTLPSGTGTPVGESGSQVGSFQTPTGSYANTVGTDVYYAQNGVPVYSDQALVQAQAMGICQGCVMIVASVPSDPNNPSAVVTQSILVQIYNNTTAQGPPSTYLNPAEPSTPASETQPVVTVAHNGGYYAFYGGVVGAGACLTTAACTVNGIVYPPYTTDNTPVWSVGPAPYSLSTQIVGGNATYGVICNVPPAVTAANCAAGVAPGTYYAPAVIPTTTNSSTTTNGEVVVVVSSQLVSTVASYAYVGVN